MILEGQHVKLLHARTIRLPKGMAESIQRSAEMNQRTFNTEVLWRLHQSFKKPTIEQVLEILMVNKGMLEMVLKKQKPAKQSEMVRGWKRERLESDGRTA